MVKIRSLAILAALLAAPAAAQQQAIDPNVISVYKQLLGEANDRVVAMGARAQTLEVQVRELTKQLEDEKAKHKPLADKSAPEAPKSP